MNKKKKKPKEASSLFEGIIKASVKDNPKLPLNLDAGKYIIELSPEIYIKSAFVGGKIETTKNRDEAKKYIHRNAAETTIEDIKLYKGMAIVSKTVIIKL